MVVTGSLKSNEADPIMIAPSLVVGLDRSDLICLIFWSNKDFVMVLLELRLLILSLSVVLRFIARS